MKQFSIEFAWIDKLFKKAKTQQFVPIDMIDILPHHKTRKWRTRNVEKTVDTVVIHVADTFANVVQIANYDVGPNHVCKKGCPGFSYHYVITYPDGKIIQANHLRHITYHCKHKNLNGVGIMFQGKFTCLKAGDYKNAFAHSNLKKGDVRKEYVDPTDKQLVSLIQLLDALNEILPKYDYKTNLLGHCDVDPVNRGCDPGDTVYFMLQVYKRIRSRYV